jgi:hypothetical protein
MYRYLVSLKVKHIFIKFIVNIVKHTILYQHLEMFLKKDENYNSILELNIELYLYTNNKYNNYIYIYIYTP